MRPANDRAVNGQRGFTLIDLLFVIALVGLLSTLAIPGLMRARGAAHSASALGTMRVVNSAQLGFAITCGLGFYAPDFPALTRRPAGAVDAFLPPDLGGGPAFVKSGYNFGMAGLTVDAAPASCNGLPPGETVSGYAIVADQLEAPPGRGRHFATNADGVIYEHTSSFRDRMPVAGPPPAGSPLQ